MPWPTGVGHLVPAMALCLTVGAGCGLANGLISALWSIPSFIVTLGMLEVARGTAYLVTNSQTKYIGPRIEAVAQPLGRTGRFTRVTDRDFGGSDRPDPAHPDGLGPLHRGRRAPTSRLLAFLESATRRIKLTTFVLSGLLAALGSVFQVARLSSADPNGGIGMELSAIAAVVIGGTSLMGGQGSVFRSFLGVLIIAVLQTGLAQVGRDRAHQTADHRRRHRAGRRRRRPPPALDRSSGHRIAPTLAFQPASTLRFNPAPSEMPLSEAAIQAHSPP